METPRLRKKDVIAVIGEGFVKRTARRTRFTRTTVYNWGEYLPEAAARRILDEFPEMAEHVIDPDTGMSPKEASDLQALKLQTKATERGVA